ncbi:MAG: mycofactocin precursor MftA [Acidimicrobiales bacterium]
MQPSSAPTANDLHDGTAAADTIVVDAEETLVEDELLIEEISIDGMCGVY